MNPYIDTMNSSATQGIHYDVNINENMFEHSKALYQYIICRYGVPCPIGQEHHTQALVFLISRLRVQVPFLKSLRNTLNHYCFDLKMRCRGPICRVMYVIESNKPIVQRRSLPGCFFSCLTRFS